MEDKKQKFMIITIARGYGSGGRTLGKHLAKELGIQCYDREILKMASDESGINEALFGAADEKKTGVSLFRGNHHYKGDVIPPESDDFVSNDNLFNYQAKIIKDLAQRESCIIIGRCADYVLKDAPNLIRLYFYAPLKDCILRLKGISGEPERDLIKKIEKIDKYRAEFYKYYTGNEWNDTRNYDFCLNTSSMSYEKLIEVVKAYLDICRK
ncbi:cytidylate kinase-like family protein [Lachnospiraceae bacterium ZAX-1]